MIGHDYPPVNNKTLMVNAIVQAICNNKPVFIPGKNVYPLYYSEGDKVICILFGKFITSTHIGKIRLRKWKTLA
jgi:hypothetical protein